jgi:DNA topoisomerase-1
VQVFAGRYGPYVRHGNVMASLPKGRDPADATLDEAVTLLAAKAGAPKAARGRGAKPAAKPKAEAKPKAAAKKAAPAKTGAKKAAKPAAKAAPKAPPARRRGAA